MHLAPSPPPPSARELLPPLLACLPTSFVSPRPPPALLPLLSPLLRQRVSFLSTSGKDGWLPLLSWDQQRASKLPAVIERMDLEPHPVSGELELEDPRPAKYRRLDEETLHARIELQQFGLLPVYVWCEKDEHGGTDPGWKLADLRTLDDAEDGNEWFESPGEASNAQVARPSSLSHGIDASNGLPAHVQQERQLEEEDDTNDDYWAQYDETPSRTPAPKRSPAPISSSANQSANHPRPRSRSEMEYFARYGSEVQPALDSHDPDEDVNDHGSSTLTGDSLVRAQAAQAAQAGEIKEQADYLSSLKPHAGWEQPQGSAPVEQHTNGELSMPRAISPTASHSSIDKLEERAAEMSTDGGSDRAHLAIKQHISTDIKSLFRLAKTTGMARVEFERIVRTELDVLGLMERDE